MLSRGCVGYNIHMDKTKLTNVVARRVDRVWGELCEIHPKLTRLDPPKIKLNNRLYRTAGRCWQDARMVDLGVKFFEHSREYGIIMLNVILPHELIHQADYDLFGDSDKKCGHGANWRMLMVQYGLKPNPFHNMEVTR